MGEGACDIDILALDGFLRRGPLFTYATRLVSVGQICNHFALRDEELVAVHERVFYILRDWFGSAFAHVTSSNSSIAPCKRTQMQEEQ